ncbi:MAG: Hsp20/alpha crystallin family protein [Desulfobacterales bacterium]
MLLINRPYRTFRTPFFELDRLRNEMDRIYAALSGAPGQAMQTGVFPQVNLTEENENFYIRAELPGIKAEDLDISATENTITISGERKIEPEEGVKYHRREREAGKFSRAFSLPAEIDPERVAADLKNGMLILAVPKAEKAKPRQIKVS